MNLQISTYATWNWIGKRKKWRRKQIQLFLNKCRRILNTWVKNHNPLLISTACSDNTWIDRQSSDISTINKWGEVENEMYARITSLFYREFFFLFVFSRYVGTFPAIWRILFRWLLHLYSVIWLVVVVFFLNFFVMSLFMSNETKVSKREALNMWLCNVMKYKNICHMRVRHTDELSIRRQAKVKSKTDYDVVYKWIALKW